MAEMAKMDNLSASHTIAHLMSQFSRYGIPDKGPQFANSAFIKFAKEYGFEHVTTSPLFPQANGQIERTIQTVKRILLKSEDPYKGLLAYRNTTLEDLGLSPAQIFLNRRLKTDIPTTSTLLEPATQSGIDVRERLKTRKARQKQQHDRHAGPPLRNLFPGEKVVAKHQGQWVPATVVAKHVAPRSCVIESASGRKLRRNRLHLRPTNASNIPTQKDSVPINNKVPGQDVEPHVAPPPYLAESTSHSGDTCTPVVTKSGRVVKSRNPMNL
ncbi:uncharacterized protein LOC117334854 [Pecten maximus]|uniref:uncharacterized protein LOC117334854 n=1 Tax=Pecten maximus TaxID=6579 RepID=UPI001457EA79|nr:uncharacterized protein LOC117334854 [Pecten maximus]